MHYMLVVCYTVRAHPASCTRRHFIIYLCEHYLEWNAVGSSSCPRANFAAAIEPTSVGVPHCMRQRGTRVKLSYLCSLPARDR